MLHPSIVISRKDGPRVVGAGAPWCRTTGRLSRWRDTATARPGAALTSGVYLDGVAGGNLKDILEARRAGSGIVHVLTALEPST